MPATLQPHRTRARPGLGEARAVWSHAVDLRRDGSPNAYAVPLVSDPGGDDLAVYVVADPEWFEGNALPVNVAGELTRTLNRLRGAKRAALQGHGIPVWLPKGVRTASLLPANSRAEAELQRSTVIALPMRSRAEAEAVVELFRDERTSQTFSVARIGPGWGSDAATLEASAQQARAELAGQPIRPGSSQHRAALERAHAAWEDLWGDSGVARTRDGYNLPRLFAKAQGGGYQPNIERATALLTPLGTRLLEHPERRVRNFVAGLWLAEYQRAQREIAVAGVRDPADAAAVDEGYQERERDMLALFEEAGGSFGEAFSYPTAWGEFAPEDWDESVQGPDLIQVKRLALAFAALAAADDLELLDVVDAMRLEKGSNPVQVAGSIYGQGLGANFISRAWDDVEAELERAARRTEAELKRWVQDVETALEKSFRQLERTVGQGAELTGKLRDSLNRYSKKYTGKLLGFEIGLGDVLGVPLLAPLAPFLGTAAFMPVPLPVIEYVGGDIGEGNWNARRLTASVAAGYGEYLISAAPVASLIATLICPPIGAVLFGAIVSAGGLGGLGLEALAAELDDEYCVKFPYLCDRLEEICVDRPELCEHLLPPVNLPDLPDFDQERSDSGDGRFEAPSGGGGGLKAALALLAVALGGGLLLR